MPPKKRRGKRKNRSRHFLLVLLLILIGVFALYGEFGRQDLHRKIYRMFSPAPAPAKKPGIVAPRLPSPALPKAAIVIDDLGTNRKMAMEVLTLDAPVTLSILPQEVYSAWVAEEGHRIGLDVIVHIPMEASRPLRLGKGGLYAWMSNEEIAETVTENIRSVPHSIGASSHMGSALTEDARCMQAVISELKRKGFFFLDSLTTPKTVGYHLAQKEGIRAFQRDVFLDDKDDPHEISVQWERLVRIAKDRGYAIVLGHPRENTLAFLEKVLRNNQDVTVVPLSQLPVN